MASVADFGPATANAAAAQFVEWFDDAPIALLGWQALGDGALNGWGKVEITPPSGSVYTFAGKFKGRFGQKWEQRIPYGKPSAVPVWTNQKATQVRAYIKILSPVDLANYSLLVKELFVLGAPGAVAVGVSSSALSMVGIQQLYFTDGDLPEAPENGDAAVFQLRFQTWKPPNPGGLSSTVPVVAGQAPAVPPPSVTLKASDFVQNFSLASSPPTPSLTLNPSDFIPNFTPAQ